ncbi:uncharacterized protein [Henckelia pumila]|uniref:uncharacterized protein n=1 Tax=Henckelia pumila TaxID=405737 RepID=UPI003C6EA069
MRECVLASLNFPEGDEVYSEGKVSSEIHWPIWDRIGSKDVSYHFALTPYLSRIHNVFHVSLLHQYVADESQVLNPMDVQLDPNMSYVERPLKIIDRRDKVLRNKRIPLVMVQWQHRGTEEAT